MKIQGNVEGAGTMTRTKMTVRDTDRNMIAYATLRDDCWWIVNMKTNKKHAYKVRGTAEEVYERLYLLKGSDSIQCE